MLRPLPGRAASTGHATAADSMGADLIYGAAGPRSPLRVRCRKHGQPVDARDRRFSGSLFLFEVPLPSHLFPLFLSEEEFIPIVLSLSPSRSPPPSLPSFLRSSLPPSLPLFPPLPPSFPLPFPATHPSPLAPAGLQATGQLSARLHYQIEMSLGIQQARETVNGLQLSPSLFPIRRGWGGRGRREERDRGPDLGELETRSAAGAINHLGRRRSVATESAVDTAAPSRGR